MTDISDLRPPSLEFFIRMYRVIISIEDCTEILHPCLDCSPYLKAIFCIWIVREDEANSGRVSRIWVSYSHISKKPEQCWHRSFIMKGKSYVIVVTFSAGLLGGHARRTATLCRAQKIVPWRIYQKTISSQRFHQVSTGSS